MVSAAGSWARLGVEIVWFVPGAVYFVELDVLVRYWEGAVRIEGTVDGEAVSGHGYVEMTGYGDDGEENGRRGPGG